MNTKILAATAFAALITIALTSCDWLFGKKNEITKNPHIAGSWSVTNIADSSKEHRNTVGILLLAMSAKDSIPITATFNADSSLILNKDTARFYLDSAYTTLFIQDDSTTESFSIKTVTDSSLQLYSDKDSLLLTLIKR